MGASGAVVQCLLLVPLSELADTFSLCITRQIGRAFACGVIWTVWRHAHILKSFPYNIGWHRHIPLHVSRPDRDAHTHMEA